MDRRRALLGLGAAATATVTWFALPRHVRREVVDKGYGALCQALTIGEDPHGYREIHPSFSPKRHTQRDTSARVERSGGKLRVVTWNVYEGNAFDTKRRQLIGDGLRRIIDEHEPHLIGLNEVGDLDTDIVRGLLGGYRATWAPTMFYNVNPYEPCPESVRATGNLLLARIPLEPKVIDLKTLRQYWSRRAIKRNAIIATEDNLTLAYTHLELHTDSEGREMQLEHVLEAMSVMELDLPADASPRRIIAGDLNARLRKREKIVRLLEGEGYRDLAAHRRPLDFADYVFARGFSDSSHGRRLDMRGSDHKPRIAYLFTT